MKKYFTLLVLFIAFQMISFAQPDGEVFPDFTVNDINGVEHHLQDYLDDGKTVLIDVFATWCGVCINSLPAVETLYEEHGPDGDNTLVILSFEADPSTSNEAAFVNNYSIPYPVISDGLVEMEDWNTIGQPNFFVICTDGSFDYHFGGVSGSNMVLADMVTACNVITTGVNEIEEEFALQSYTNPVLNTLDISLNGNSRFDYMIYDLSGKTILSGTSELNKKSIDLSELESGIYFLQLSDKTRYITKKLIKQ